MATVKVFEDSRYVDPIERKTNETRIVGASVELKIGEDAVCYLSPEAANTLARQLIEVASEVSGINSSIH